MESVVRLCTVMHILLSYMAASKGLSGCAGVSAHDDVGSCSSAVIHSSCCAYRSVFTAVLARHLQACLDSSFDSSQAPLMTTQLVQKLLHEEQLSAALRRQHNQQQQQQDPAPKRLRSTFSRRNRSPEDGDGGGGSSRAGGGLEGLIQSAAASITGHGSATASSRRADQSGGSSSAAAAAAAAAAGSSRGDAGAGSSSSSSSSEFNTRYDLVNSAQLLMKRELSLGQQQGFSRQQQRHMCCHRALPLHPSKVRLV
jgi:hypothetical protein